MIIDVHGHVTPPELLARYPMPPSLGDVAGMVEKKAAVGIDLTIVGSPVGFGTMMPVPGLDNYAQGVGELRRFHDWLAETVAAHPGRLAAYVYTDPFGGDDLLSLAAELLREPAFVGLLVNTSVRGELLDSPRAESFFAMAGEAGVPVLLHPPAQPIGHASFRDPRLVEQVARWSDVTAGIAAVLWAGWLERWPGLRVIAATGGGGLPLLVEKLDLAHAPPHWVGSAGGGPPTGGPPTGGPSTGGPPTGGPPTGGPPTGGPPSAPLRTSRPPSSFLDQVYVDTATPSRAALAAALQALGTTRMLFATDSPPLHVPLQEVIAGVDALALSDEDRAAVLGGNARELFRLDGGARATGG